MRERVITLLCAIGALALFLGLFTQSGSQLTNGRDIPRPTTQERRGNGYYAVGSWLEAEGVRVVSLRERFGSLASRRDLPSAGNVLVITLPAAAGYNTEEFVPLDRWVRAGNTLVVLAALADTPDWAFLDRGLAPADLNLLSGVSFETVQARQLRARRTQGKAPERAQVDLAAELRPFAEPERLDLIPNREHAYFNHVRSVVALSDYAHQDWALRVPYDGFALELAHEAASGAGALWTRPLGAGRIIVSAFGTLFTNRAIGLADNAQLLANLIAVDRSAHGAVLFDDAHQGLAAGYDAQRFYRDRRLYLTAAIVCGLWLTWVVGSTRLRAPTVRVPTVREADLVRATGGFLARVVPRAAAARRMLELFLERAVPRTVVPGSPWQYLERHPRIAARDLAQLQAWYADANAGRRVPLVSLHNLIVRLDALLRA